MRRPLEACSRSRRPAAAAPFFDEAPHVDPFDELHHDVVQAPVFAHIVHAGDVLVIELGGRLGLVLETQQRSWSLDWPGGRTFRATVRANRGSMARKTRPMPPPPTYSTSSKSPKWSPGRIRPSRMRTAESEPAGPSPTTRCVITVGWSSRTAGLCCRRTSRSPPGSNRPRA